ncbi:MAG: ATP-binding cassette domain-containing protein [Methanoregulaceae archaeon]|nr:ATP-binding cassette domain-containing protein [Methanoregulaceae archaeon]
MTAEHPDTPGDRDRTPANDDRDGKGTKPDDDIIRIEHLTKVFKNARTVVAVDDVSLTVQRGEIFGLLGPNGAGKSTLIRILTTLMKPTSGTASIESYDVTRYPEKIRSRIGVCPQNSTLDLELSAFDNLDFYGRLQNVDDKTLATRIPELLGMVELADRADARVSTFSGGMRRKLEIVRAFIHHPSILFLDEPTIGLDPESRREVWKQINRLNTEETTIILTTHYMDEAEKLCDRIAFMDEGRLISLDTPGNLKRAMPGGDLIEIGFSELKEGILPVVRSHASVVSVELQGQKMLISAHEGSSLLPALLADFEGFSIPVTSITIRSPSLEDVFIYLTGRKLDGSGVGGPDSPSRGVS